MGATSDRLVDVAVTLPGEADFLAAIVDDPRNPEPRLVYADWLEEVGDARAAYVRNLVSATRTLDKSTSLPDVSPYPRAWSNMLGAALFEGVLEFDLLAAVDAVFAVARPTVVIETTRVDEADIPIGASKFGGRPDLPADVPWPTCEAGPLGFLGQIALSELKDTQAARALPPDGLLSFFAFQDADEGVQPGVYDGPEGDTSVLFTPAGAALSRRELAGTDEDGFELDEYSYGPFPSCQLKMWETWDLPRYDDKLPAQFAPAMKAFQSSERKEQLSDLRFKCGAYRHHLLGYSIHARTDDPTPGLDWRHILCLDSDDNLWWSWCDGEHLAVYVHEEDVQNRSFARVFGYAS